MESPLTFGENKQATVTLAERLIVTDMLVILKATWLAVPKYNGTKANHITHVVYIVKPICFDSLKASGIFRVSTA